MFHRRSGAPRPASSRSSRGASSLVLGALGALLVAVAIGLTAVSRPTVTGLVLVAVGLVLALPGLVLGTVGATRGQRVDRVALTGAALSVAALSGGLVWLAFFVFSGMAGPAPVVDVGPPGEVPAPACVAAGCPTPG